LANLVEKGWFVTEEINQQGGKELGSCSLGAKNTAGERKAT
jgi:hypothetical protein